MYVPQLFIIIIAQQFFSPFQFRPTTRIIFMNKTPFYLNDNLGTAKKVFLCVCVKPRERPIMLTRDLSKFWQRILADLVGWQNYFIRLKMEAVLNA